MTIICSEISEYLDYYEDKKEEFNQDRINLIENIVKPTLARNDVFFDEKTYKNCLVYCEKNYYPLFLYQKFIYAFFFMYIDDSPLFTTFVIMMGRGNGKDGGFMPLINFFQTPLYGVKNYHIDIIANSEEQAHDSFDVVYDMLHENKKFKGKFIVTKEKIVNLKTNSILRYNTSNPKTKDGKKGGLLYFNEYHAYETYGQINVFTSQKGKIKHPRTIINTTNGYVRDGPLDDTLIVCREILESGENDLNWFPFLCCLNNAAQADDDTKWILPNPSMPYMPILAQEIKQEYLEAKKMPHRWPEFMTKRMNMPEEKKENEVTSWDNILRCCYTDIKKKIPRITPELKHRAAVIGIDYADIRDFATAGLLFKIDGEYVWRSHTWVCKNNPYFENIKFPFQNMGQDGFNDFEITEQSTIPISDIVDWCLKQMKIYDVQKIVMDTYRFNLFREEFEKKGIMQETKKDPYELLRMIRRSNSIYALIAPLITKSFENGMINYGKSSIMRWFTRNTGLVLDGYGNSSFVKIEPKLRKTDGFMAFVHAMSAENLLDEFVIEM